MIPRLFLAGYPVRFVVGVGLALGSGCGAVCEGPGCDELFSEAELAIVNPAGADEVKVPSGAAHVVEGSEADGFDWTVAPFDGGAFIGAPAAAAVLKVSADARQTGDPWWADADPRSRLGAALVRVGDELWIGAPGAERGAGAVYVVPSDLADPSAASARLTLTGATPEDQLGESLFACGGDVAVTAPLFAAPGDWTLGAVPDLAGAVFLVPAGSAGAHRPWELDGARVWWGDSAGAGAGAAVVCLPGDLNGDGAADIAIGSPWANGGRGQVHLLSVDAPSGPLGERSWRILDGVSDEWLGRSLAAWDTAGGVVLAVGGPGYGPDDDEAGLGRVKLYVGASLASDDVTPDPIGTIEGVRGLSAPQHFGRWLTTGDLDGDAELDLVVGAPDLVDEDDDGAELFDSGRIWVWYGWSPPSVTVSLLADAAPFEVRSERAFQGVGRAVVAADYDGDGDDELWIPTRDLGASAAE